MVKNKDLTEIYIQETKNSLKVINKILGKVSIHNYEDSLSAIQEQLQLVQINSQIAEFNGVEYFCIAIEQIISSVINKNIIFTQNVIDFLKICIARLGLLKDSEDFKERKTFEGLIKLCDKVSAGEIIELEAKKEVQKKNESQEEYNYKVSLNKIDGILKNFEEVFSQEIRLKKQLENLSMFDNLADNSDFTKYRKNVENPIYSLENVLKNIQNEVAEIRMQPVSIVYDFLKEKYSMIENQSVAYNFENENVLIDKDIIPNLKIILTKLLLNFARLGFIKNTSAKINIIAKKDDHLIELQIIGNGKHINLEMLRKKIKLQFPNLGDEIDDYENDVLLKYLFSEGFTGEKEGLDKVWKECETIKGSLKVEQPDNSSFPVFKISFPMLLNSESGFFVRFGTEKYFIPSQFVVDSVLVNQKETFVENQKTFFVHRNEKVQIHNFVSILDESRKNQNISNGDNISILVVAYLEQTIAIQVDEIISFSSVVVKKLPDYFKDFAPVKGVIFDENNDIVPILYVPFLIKKFSTLRGYELKKSEVFSRKIVNTILVADSSKFAREVVSSILSSNGYYVLQAKDGIEAMENLKKQKIDFVVCSKDMPRMNGVILLENIVRNDDYKNIPVILLPFQSTQSEKSELLEKGACAVIEKNNFDRNELLSIIQKNLLSE